MERVKYICFYDKIDAEIERNYVLAATTKIDYIISALNKNNIGVDIVSFSGCVEKKCVFAKGGVSHDGVNTLRLFHSFGSYGFFLTRILSRWFVTLQFIFWFLISVKKNEEIIIYHSLGYAGLFLFLKRIKSFSIIGEIEELYQNVTKYSKKEERDELAFVDACDKYIFPTLLLNKKVNTYNKPFVIIHGLYQVEKDRKVSFNDNKIHAVYAGTFDPNKGGAAAAAAAAFLPENYHIHILGFGNKEDTEFIKETIQSTALKSKATVTFDGLLKGEEFIEFLQKCEIGLSTQDPAAAFNGTSFPSKILVYMANGLKVVSIKIPAIEQSGVGSYISYYENQTPEEIADAIRKVSEDNNFVDGRSVLNRLDEEFIQELNYLINNNHNKKMKNEKRIKY